MLDLLILTKIIMFLNLKSVFKFELVIAKKLYKSHPKFIKCQAQRSISHLTPDRRVKPYPVHS